MLAACVAAALGAAPAAMAASPLLISQAAGPPLRSPQAVAVDAAGNVYIADTSAEALFKLSPDGSVSGIAQGLSGPSGVAVDAAGDVYVSDSGNHEVDKLTWNGGFAVSPVASGLGSPAGLAVDAAGDLFIADPGRHQVDKVTPDGTLSVIAGTGTAGSPVTGTATASPLNNPTGVAVDANGNVYIADSGAAVVAKVTPAGALSIFAGKAGLPGTPTAGTATSVHLRLPSGVAVDSSGNVYIADAGANYIEKVASGRLSLFAGTGRAAAPVYGATATSSPLDGPAGIAVAPGGVFYVADTGNGSVDRLAPPPPAGLSAPGITGTPTQGQTLTAGPGTWTNSPSAFSYQWEDCPLSGGACAPIAGAASSTYKLQNADAGGTVRVVVTAANAGGSASQTSAPTAAIIPLPPAGTSLPGISGTPTDTATLTATPGAWSNRPTSFAYQWQDCNSGGSGCSAIAGATSSQYVLQSSDVGATIRVAVTAVNAGGSDTVSSPATAVIAPAVVPWADTAPPAAERAPSISGATGVGQTLTCSAGTWSGTPATYAYQWRRRGMPIAGATAAQYVIAAADLGQTLSCSVAATNAGGTSGADSAPVSIPAKGARSAPDTGAGSTPATGAGSASPQLAPAACPNPAATVTGAILGPLRLGASRAVAAACLGAPGGAEIRGVYPSSRIAAQAARAGGSKLSGRVVLAVTVDPGYVIHGLRVRGTFRGGRLGTSLHLRGAVWHVFRIKGATGLVEVRGAVVREIGIASATLPAGSLRRLLAGVTR